MDRRNGNALYLGQVRNLSVMVPNQVLDSSIQHSTDISNQLGFSEIESSLFSTWSLSVCALRWSHMLGVMGKRKQPDVSQLRVLELGCGNGLFTLMGRFLGFNVVGIEPQEQQYRAAQALVIGNGEPRDAIRNAKAEALPFENCSFDVVCSFQVLEHVEDVDRAVLEAKRVLKPGGLFYNQCPNYLYPYEAHYGLFAPLFLGKQISRRFLRKRGRPIVFLEQLNWIIAYRLRRILGLAGFTDISAGPISEHHINLSADVTAAELPWRFRRHESQHGIAGRLFARLSSTLPISILTKMLGMYPQIEVVAWVK